MNYSEIHSQLSIEEQSMKRTKTNRRKLWETMVKDTVNQVLSERAEEYAPKYSDPELQQWIKDMIAAYKDSNVKQIRNLLDSSIGKSQKAGAFLRSGKSDGTPEDDVIEIKVTKVKAKDLQPSQGFIDCNQSVAFPLCKVKKGIVKCYEERGGHTAGDLLSVAGNVILDGHHRWSSVLAQNPETMINVRDFVFPSGVSDNQKLAVMQVAIGSVRKPGQALPSKGGSAADDILGDTASNIETTIAGLVGNPAQDSFLKGQVLMGDKWFQEALQYKEVFADLFDVTEEDWQNAITDENQLKDMGVADCPCRMKIISKMASNLSQMKPQISGGPEIREDMPQLDHKEIGGDAGFAKIRDKMADGSVQWNNMDAGLVEESIDLARWNKLAGVLKD